MPRPRRSRVAHETDLTQTKANAAAFPTALERFGRLDVVIANAGTQQVEAIEEFPDERWEVIIALMLTSPFLLAKYAWSALRDSGTGWSIVISV